MRMANNKLLSWGDVESVAYEAFAIWGNHTKELEFAKEAWQKLSEQNLTSYSTELERSEVIFRFFALTGIYHGFCEKAFDEKVDCEFNYWAETLNLEHFVVGRYFEKIKKDNNNEVDIE